MIRCLVDPSMAETPTLPTSRAITTVPRSGRVATRIPGASTRSEGALAEKGIRATLIVEATVTVELNLVLTAPDCAPPEQGVDIDSTIGDS